MPHVTREKLDAAVPHILAAPKDGAAISMLCLRPNFGERRFVDEISLTQAQGIPGERWSRTPWLKLADGTPDPQIQVCILQQRVLDLVWRDRAETVHPGDTCIADLDMSYENLPTGQLLQVGSAILRVSEHFNDACVKWKARYGADAKDWVNDPKNIPYRLRGILCSIHQDGLISTGDILSKLDPK
jgi:hypothetical protein